MTTIEELIDKDDIIARKLAYVRAADNCDPDGMVSFFTDDVTASYVRGEIVQGKSAIRDWYAGSLVNVAASSHHLSNFEISFPTPDEASLRCYLYSWQRYKDHPATKDRVRLGRYVDTWVRRGDTWFQSSLVCLPAAEWGSAPVLRFGEYLGWDQ